MGYDDWWSSINGWDVNMVLQEKTKTGYMTFDICKMNSNQDSKF